jgi:hypothetical protein
MGGPDVDSTLGKAVERVGDVVGSQRVARMGRGMRVKEGFGKEDEGVERIAN